MSALVVDFPAGALAKRRGVQIDFGTWLRKLERTLSWLDRNHVEIASFACSTFKGARVHAIACGRLQQLLSEEKVSRGHRHFGGFRIEQWEARDPINGVLIVWEEEARA